MNFTVDPKRRESPIRIGIKVLAKAGRTYIAADIAQLTGPSLLRYLRHSGGDNPCAEALVLKMLGHSPVRRPTEPAKRRRSHC